MGRIAQDVIVKLLSGHRAISHVEAYSKWDSVCQKPVGSARCTAWALWTVACIAQWNRLPLAKLGHITPSTFCRFLFPTSKINQDTTEWFFELGRLDDNNLLWDAKRIPVPIPLVPPKNRPRTLWKRDGAIAAAQRVLSIIEPNGGFSCKPRLMTPEGTWRLTVKHKCNQEY